MRGPDIDLPVASNKYVETIGVSPSTWLAAFAALTAGKSLLRIHVTCRLAYRLVPNFISSTASWNIASEGSDALK